MELITIPTEHKDHFKTMDTRIFENPELSSVAVKFHCYAISRPPNWDLKWPNLLGIFKERRDASFLRFFTILFKKVMSREKST